MSKGHAPEGGVTSEINGAFYKGGQFLPSTDQPPGTWKVAGKTMKSGREQVGPFEYEKQPTPLSRSIYTLVSGFSKRDKEGKLSLVPGIKDATGEPVSTETKIRPGVKGILSRQEHSMGQLIEQYNSGSRWINVDIPEDQVQGPPKPRQAASVVSSKA